jgi:hypothetical protein
MPLDPDGQAKQLADIYLNEFIKDSIRKTLDKPRSRLEHPLTLVIVSFVLTGLIGTGISLIFQRNEAQRERQRQDAQSEQERDIRHYETSTRAIVAFSDSIYSRYVRAGLLKSALARRASVKEILHRKELYDEALVSQESQVLGMHLLIREALREQDYDDFERYYQFGLKPRLSLLDKVLTKLVDEYVNDPISTKTTLDSHLPCVTELYDQVLVCSSAVTNAVFRSVSSRRYLSGKQVIDTEQKAKADVERGCPLQQEYMSPSCAGLE